MALADGVLAPQSPTIYAIYRGFYIIPTDILPTSVVRIDFFVSRSSDDLTWENWQLFTYGDNTVGMYGVHTGLDENTYYAYYCQYVYSDGSKSPVGQTGNAGPAQLTISSNLNIDQLASRAYTTGLVTSGIFQGVVFRTAPFDPKVQMDPTGIWADDASGNKIFYIHADGTTAFFSGQIDLNEGSGYLVGPGGTGGQGSEISWGGPFTAVLSPTNNPGTGTDNAGVGTAIWSNPNNVTLNNESNPAAVFPNSGETTHYLVAKNYQFSIPSTATITGIVLSIDRVNIGNFTASGCHDNRVRLIKGGAIQTTDKASGNNWPLGSFGSTSYGASNDLWGTTWTVNDINSSGFGAALSVIDNAALFVSQPEVAAMQITVYYTNPALSENSSWIQGVAISGHHQLAVGASGTGITRKLIQDDGTSDFLQNANNLSELANKSTARNNLGFKWGAAQITVAANTTFTIQHTLGVTPAFFIGFPAGWTGFLITPGGTDATNMTFQASVALSNNFVTWFAFA